MDMKLTFKFTLVSFRPNVTDSYFLCTINERHVCSRTLSLSGKPTRWMVVLGWMTYPMDDSPSMDDLPDG